MTQTPSNNQNHTPLIGPSRGGFSPGQLAAVLGAYIRALILVVFWSVAGVAAVAIGYLAVRAIWFAVQTVSTAIGI